ncbi:MAG: hypothetical protein K0S47_2213 [Herbinix sp.]|jgi:hypothetical protein|nr:hypothetical protein [Herbinix sp.]
MWKIKLFIKKNGKSLIYISFHHLYYWGVANISDITILRNNRLNIEYFTHVKAISLSLLIINGLNSSDSDIFRTLKCVFPQEVYMFPSKRSNMLLQFIMKAFSHGITYVQWLSVGK